MTSREQRRGRRVRALEPLLWTGPAIALICVVVLWPVYVMFRTSFQKISPDGFVIGGAGWENFRELFKESALDGVLLRTVLWTLAVVAVTIVCSLALAQLFNQRFPARKVTRWALIAPWAASVTMTSLVFRWALDPTNGTINVLLHDVGLLSGYNSNTADWLGRPTSALIWMMVVAVFVSLPFTTYAILAGLQSIDAGLYEAVRVDGATTWRTYWSITLPLLRPALIVSALINVINVFNSFPIIWEMTRGGPGYSTSTTTLFMFKIKSGFIGESAAMSAINFLLVILVVLFFLRATKWREAVSQ